MGLRYIKFFTLCAEYNISSHFDRIQLSMGLQAPVFIFRSPQPLVTFLHIRQPECRDKPCTKWHGLAIFLTQPAERGDIVVLPMSEYYLSSACYQRGKTTVSVYKSMVSSSLAYTSNKVLNKKKNFPLSHCNQLYLPGYLPSPFFYSLCGRQWLASVSQQGVRG